MSFAQRVQNRLGKTPKYRSLPRFLKTVTDLNRQMIQERKDQAFRDAQAAAEATVLELPPGTVRKRSVRDELDVLVIPVGSKTTKTRLEQHYLNRPVLWEGERIVIRAVGKPFFLREMVETHRDKDTFVTRYTRVYYAYLYLEDRVASSFS